MGLNTRSFDNIWFVDAALLGTADLHADAKAVIARRAATDIKVGLPLFPFVDLDLPGDAYNFWGVRNTTTSVALRRKYEAAKSSLSDGGFTLVQQEWPKVASKHFGREVNAALETLFGNRRINNQDYDGICSPHMHSFTPQASQQFAYFSVG